MKSVHVEDELGWAPGRWMNTASRDSGRSLRFPRGWLGTVLLLGSVSGPAMALQSDRAQPMDIAADTTDAVLSDAGTAILKGNVTISQGTLKIQAAQATLSRAEGEVRRAVLTGSPATVQQQLDTGGQMTASAASIDYDLTGNTLELTGNVVIDQPEGSLRGERVRYHIADGRIEGGAPGSRVQMRIPGKPAAASQPTDD
jgi:lipopolysaccharide export system protein LptA